MGFPNWRTTLTNTHFARFSIEITLPMSGVEICAGVEIHYKVEPGPDKCLKLKKMF